VVKTAKLGLRMKKKIAVLATEDDLSVDLTLHDFSATLLAEFAEKIVRPYYSGNMSEAVKNLMQKAIGEEKFVLSHVKLIKSGKNSI
jgi:alanine-alpha-ketoisovalerate/valine-pyruvate aminotransferase